MLGFHRERKNFTAQHKMEDIEFIYEYNDWIIKKDK